MGLFVDGDRGVWLEQFTVQSGKYSNVVRGPRGRTYQSVILVDHLDELTDQQWHRLYPLYLFFRAYDLFLQLLRVFFYVVFLNLKDF